MSYYTGRTFSKCSFHQSFLRIYSFQYFDGNFCHPHRPHRLVTGQKFSQEKSFSSKIFENLILYFDNFPFIKAFNGNEIFRTSIVSCAILSDLARCSFKKKSDKTVKFWSRKAEILKYPTGRTLSNCSFHQSFLRIYSFQYFDGNFCHPHRPHRLVTGQKFSQEKSFSSKIFENLILYFDDLPFIKAFLENRTFRSLIVSCAILSHFA